MHNRVIQTLDAELVVFLNNDVEICSEHWLEQMVATLELAEDVAGVGALLRYPDGRVQHGGIILGLNGLVGHAHRFLPAGHTGYFDRCVCLQELSAATAACLLMKRSAFLAVGGFRAERYPTSFNEVDLWLRLRSAGYRCLYNPAVEAIHYESATRKVLPASEGVYRERLAEDWGEFLAHDPFYNPNLALDNEQFHGFRIFPLKGPLAPPALGGQLARRDSRAVA
jgi:GT2 family glycosyltransferase